jgi:hypothetical protein
MADVIESIFGSDIAFDASPGLTDAIASSTETDLAYRVGVLSLREEIERLFMTPKGSFVDDPTYGIDWGLIGTNFDPRVSLGMARLAALNALQHPSFNTRFRVRQLETDYSFQTPNAIYVYGLLEVFGFSGAAFQFGPIALQLMG